ncbi:MAG: LptF/LptG family permease [Planctomycetes bacterium]|nr:LptF/LptG family permease [Planctomycetota bacterium]
MKLIDRYLLSTFGTALALVAATFTTLFLVMDMSSKLARFLALRNIDTWRFFVQYYLVRLPLFFYQILPAVTIFAAMFTLMRMQKTNELLPLMTSGISLRRVSAVFVAGALACAAAMAALDEFALPPLMSAVGETDELLLSDKTARNVVAWRAETYLLAGAYNRRTRQIEDVKVSRLRPNGKPEWDLTAKRGSWDENQERWILFEGHREPYDEEGHPRIRMIEGKRPERVVEPLPAEGFVLGSDLHPEDFQKKTFSLSGRFYRMNELLELIREYPQVASFRMQFHAKLTTPLGALVLLFLGLPWVAGSHSGSYSRGVGLCLLLTVAYYAAHFTFLQSGIRGDSMNPVVAAWLPTLAFGTLGLVGFLRMRS